MGRIRKVDRWRGEEMTGKPGTALNSSDSEWADWLPWSLHCAAANCAAAPVGVTVIGGAPQGRAVLACLGKGHRCGVDAGMEIWGGGERQCLQGDLGERDWHASCN